MTEGQEHTRSGELSCSDCVATSSLILRACQLDFLAKRCRREESVKHTGHRGCASLKDAEMKMFLNLKLLGLKLLSIRLVCGHRTESLGI